MLSMTLQIPSANIKADNLQMDNAVARKTNQGFCWKPLKAEIRPLKGSPQSRINLCSSQVGWSSAHLQFVFLTPALHVHMA